MQSLLKQLTGVTTRLQVTLTNWAIVCCCVHCASWLLYCISTGLGLPGCTLYIAACSGTCNLLSGPGKAPTHTSLSMQAQAALSGQLVVARQQHADVCMQLQKEHAALQQAALQEHAIQKVTWPHLAAFMYSPCFGYQTHTGKALPLNTHAVCVKVAQVAVCLLSQHSQRAQHDQVMLGIGAGYVTASSRRGNACKCRLCKSLLTSCHLYSISSRC